MATDFLGSVLEPHSEEFRPFKTLGIAFGQGARSQLEVLCCEYTKSPTEGQLRSTWKSRQDSRGIPLVLVVFHNDKVSLCGYSGTDPNVYLGRDVGQVERICIEALDQLSHHAAQRSLRDSLGALENDEFPGLRNEGFLAEHELVAGVPNRADWEKATKKSTEIMKYTGTELLHSLGFTADRLDNVTDVLKIEGRKNGVAILLSAEETPEIGSDRIPGDMSPVSYALARADEENLKWVIVLHGRKIRLYPVEIGVGVGRRGRTETFIELHTALVPDQLAGYLWLIFSAEALKSKGTLAQMLDDSRDFAGDLASQLRERIYDEVIPRLAEGIAKERKLKKPTAQQLAQTYQMAMHVLFRLLFIAYGEDKNLLPYRFNGLYQKRSLKTKAKELQELLEQDVEFDVSTSLWTEVKSIFDAISKGRKEWGVPAYNGGLFSSNPKDSVIGAELDKISLPNSVFGPVLQSLLLVPTKEGGSGPVDFRSLGVREFGTIYEGLLEAELSVAETDLTVERRGKNKDAYRPCKDDEEALIKKGSIYLHNASGVRKSSGSYYTPQFAVEHLLDKSLEPALDDHFKRLDALDDLEAGENFFDFKVTDIAMGSGHFLIAAIDRIEARFSRYLVKRPLPKVNQELDKLRAAALAALGDMADSYPEIEDNSLIRRQIARRCIYGVDLNHVAVQLARLATWVHTFVPGLPLSLLDRNLVHGNSLVGIGQLSELMDKVKEDSGGTISIFEPKASDFVGDATSALQRLGKLTDATHEEIKEAQRIWREADQAIAPATALFDIVTAARIENEKIPFDFTRWQEEKEKVSGSAQHQHALEVLKRMETLHFPSAFPEVFLRERAGFDVILGNPPWEEATLEEHAFWARHYPGLRSLPQREQEEQKKRFRSERPDLVDQYEVQLGEAEVTRKALVRGPSPVWEQAIPISIRRSVGAFGFLWRRKEDI